MARDATPSKLAMSPLIDSGRSAGGFPSRGGHSGHENANDGFSQKRSFTGLIHWRPNRLYSHRRRRKHWCIRCGQLGRVSIYVISNYHEARLNRRENRDTHNENPACKLRIIFRRHSKRDGSYFWGISVNKVVPRKVCYQSGLLFLEVPGKLFVDLGQRLNDRLVQHSTVVLGIIDIQADTGYFLFRRRLRLALDRVVWPPRLGTHLRR